MMRPTLLVAETEPLAALSVRKLVLETGKYNVLTAHSGEEALEILEHGTELIAAAVIVSDLKGGEALAVECRRLRPAIPIIYASPNLTRIKGADHFVSSHDPEGLVNLCRRLLGDPREIETQPRNLNT